MLEEDENHSKCHGYKALVHLMAMLFSVVRVRADRHFRTRMSEAK